jgi:hypothetical protein
MFFLVVDFKSLKYTIWTGILTAFMEFLVDMLFIGHNLYKTVNHLFEIRGVPILFTFSVPLVMGVLSSQYYPRKKSYRILNVFVLSILFYCVEYALLLRGDLIYINWTWAESLTIDILTIITISWFNLVVLDKWRESL